MIVRRRIGFTILELLVVVGIISLLLGLLMSAIAGSRRKANVASCATSLRAIGQAFYAYASDERGYFPPAIATSWHNGHTVSKRWFDFLGPYLGTVFNEDGNDPEAWARVKVRPLWGCPGWDITETTGPGYAMNVYPLTTPEEPGLRELEPGRLSWVVVLALPVSGFYAKHTDWKMPSERCLVYDSISINSSLSGTWPWWEDISEGSQMPSSPHMELFTGDFNRHTKIFAQKQTVPSINSLYVDGHVALVTPRALQYSVHFYPPL